jgi:serine/threonine protein kinase
MPTASPPPQEVTQLLMDWSNGDQAALDRLLPLIYTELRRLARRYMRREVESLIASYEQDKGFIETPACEFAIALFADQLPEVPVGQSIGHYTVLAALGSGGMGEVYLAEDTQLGRKVALKLLPASLTDEQGRLRRFEQEARAASALNHPNILTIYEIGQVDGMHFIATEFIDGETLRQRMASRIVEISDVLTVAEQVVSALAYALLSATYEHERGLQWSQDLQSLGHAFAAAQKAVALDDSLPAAHLVLGNAFWGKK